MKERIHSKFLSLYGEGGTFYAAAGRINLIGEHTDYNGGYVFPGAIDKGIMAEIKPNGTDKVRLYSLDYDASAVFGLNEEDKPAEAWASYIFGVCRETIKRGGTVKAFDAVFAGDVPLGAGLSSSAALESCFAFAINDMNNNGFDRFELARIGQSTEHNYCGVMCGIMDQFASCFGKEGQLIRLNCKTLEHQYFPFKPDGYKLVLLDTCVKHELASSAYNFRRQSCERAAAAIKQNHPEVDFLSDCKRVWLDEVRDKISEEDFIRAEYVIGEVQRVLDVCDALERGDYETVGEMMYQTHFGLSRLYEVSCPELDFLAKLARKMDVTGSRVMGGGFGGCTINLVKDELYDGFIAAAREKYRAEFGHDLKVYDVVISDGARKLA
jgi:galactokinase